MDDGADSIRSWHRADLWRLITVEAGAQVTDRTRRFADAWFDLVLAHGGTVRNTADARELVLTREQCLKGPSARLASPGPARCRQEPPGLDDWPTVGQRPVAW